MERLNTAAACALNALPHDEERAFDALLASDQRLVGHLDSFRRVAVELAEGLPEIVPVASPVIWDRIVAETGIDRSDTVAPPEDISPMFGRRSLFAAVAAVAAALVFGVVAGSMLPEPTRDMAELAGAAALEPGSTSMTLTSPAGNADIGASVVVADDGTGYVIADSLPALGDGRTYQLWVIVNDEVVSAGLLGNDPEVVQFRAEGEIAGMAISNEVAGGVAVSENDPVALWLRDP